MARYSASLSPAAKTQMNSGRLARFSQPRGGPATDPPRPLGFGVGDGTRVVPPDAAARFPKCPPPPPRKVNAAADYLNTLYQPDDRLAIVAVGRHGPDPKVEQRVVTARTATRPAYQRFLRHLNATGHDIFVSMNPIQPATQSRQKADVLEVRRLQLDLDKNGPDSLRQVLADVNAGHLPSPAAVIRSSRQNYQVIWHTSPITWTPETAEDTMRRLASRYGGDSSVAEVARVMRLPGFRNKKPERDDDPVVWTPHDGGPVRPELFAHLPPPEQAAPVRRQTDKPRREPSQSDLDWAYVKDELRRGTPPRRLVAHLEKTRQDKHNPPDYAERTVRKARAALGLIQTHAVPAR